MRARVSKTAAQSERKFTKNENYDRIFEFFSCKIKLPG
jgi:hypothetical protein